MKIIAIIVVVVGLIIAGVMDAEDRANADEYYCDMVRVWHEHASLPESDRPGWPPYRHDIKCEE